MLPTQMTPPEPAVREWLSATASLLRDRRAEPRNAAQLLLLQGGEWNPSVAPLAVAGRIADIARASLPLACTMIHHCQGALLLALSGASTGDSGEMTWSLSNADLDTRPGPRWSVTGTSTTCCPPPDQDVRFIVLSRSHGHVLSVRTPERDIETWPSPGSTTDSGPTRPTVRVTEQRRGRIMVSFDDAPARVHGPYSGEMLARTARMRDLMESAAWYGALTRIADGLLAASGDDSADDPVSDLTLAEADALLGVTWSAIGEAVNLWQRGNSATAGHHIARARTLVRTSAATLLAGFVPGEYRHARRDPGVLEAREQLVGWMSRRPWTADIDVVARSLRCHGPSW